MLEASPELVAALGEPERVHTNLTRLAGREVTDQVTSWSVDRGYDSDLPAPIRATNGSAAAELRLTLTGTDQATAAQLYSPYAPHDTADIARPGQSVIHGWGVGGDALPAFRGTIRDRTADSGTGRVDLSALDGAERLRDAARLPAVLSSTGGPIASGTWIVDHLLREAGIHTAPPPRPECILYASMHGGIVPDIGYYRDHLTTPTSYRIGTDVPWQAGLEAYTEPYTIRYDPRTRTTVGGRGLFVELWVQNPIVTSSAGSQVRVTLVFQADNIVDNVYFVFDFAADQLNIGASGNSNMTKGDAGIGLRSKGSYHIGVHWTWSGKTPVARYHVTGPGVLGGYREVNMGSFVALADSQLNYVELTSGLLTEAVQISAGSTPITRATFEPAWTRGAVLTGLTSHLSAIPPTQGSAWEVISAVARAEQATAEFDPHGIFRYRPNTRFRSPGTPALTVTSAREIASLRVAEAIDSVRNVVDVPYAVYQRGSNAERFTDQGTVRSIAVGATLTLTFDYDVSEFDTAPPVLYATTVPSGSSRVRFSTSSGGFLGLHGAIESTTERDGATLRVTFRNLSSSTVYMVTSGGVSSLSIWSQRLATNSPTRLSVRRYTESSRTLYGAQVYQVPATPWIQRWDTAARIADYLLGMASRPLPLLGDVEILPDPRITLGDLVRVVDDIGAALSTPAWVVGIRTSGDNTGRVRQVLTLRATTSPGAPTDTGLYPDPPVDPDARNVLAREGVRVP